MNKHIYNIIDHGAVANSSALQTEIIQYVLDLCRNGGGTVVIPAGEFRVASLRMWSDTTLLLHNGARLIGSEECDDYEVYEVPAGVELRTDMELISQYYDEKHPGGPWREYRRAMISAYGEKNLAIIGEGDACIDGRNCYDANGEEGYRGPHGIFFTNCENIEFRGYTIGHSGNFMHQLDNCRHTRMTNVTCLGGSDGIHLHCCIDTLIEDCTFRTGDDCIAGINIRNLTVRRCDINSSCNATRMGGVHILFEDCHIHGPGYYPHRMTVVRGKGDELPREMGRHNMLALVDYFASENFPDSEPSHDIVFRNCTLENLERILNYHADTPPLQRGTLLAELTLENVRISGPIGTGSVSASPDVPLTVVLKNVICDSCVTSLADTLFRHPDEYTTVTVS